MSSYRSETDSFGAIDVPGDCYWGRRRSVRSAISRSARAKPCQPGSSTLWASSNRPRRGSMRASAGSMPRSPKPSSRRRRSRRRHARRSISARHLADGLRHPVEHECQRGDRRAGQRNADRHARRQEPGSSERPRQRSQSSNDSFPTALHVAAARAVTTAASSAARSAADSRVQARMGQIVKIGRTHLQDATPLTLGRNFPAMPHRSAPGLASHPAGSPALPLAQGGTAVGTGLNAPAASPTLRRGNRRADPLLRNRTEQVRSARQP